MQSYKDKRAIWMNGTGSYERAQCTSSWTRGLLSPEGLEEHLSTIMPKISQEKS
jgi:hypothetical protein